MKNKLKDLLVSDKLPNSVRIIVNTDRIPRSLILAILLRFRIFTDSPFSRDLSKLILFSRHAACT